MAYRRYARKYPAKGRVRYSNRGPSMHPIKRYVKKNRSNLKWGRIVKDVAMLKGLVNTEIKYLDQSHQTNDSYYTLSATPSVSVQHLSGVSATVGYFSAPLDYPTLGDDFNQREGRSLKLKSLQVKGTIRRTMNTTGGWCRAFVLVDHQAQTGEFTDPVPVMFQLDQNGDYSMSSRVNRQKNKRYSVLMSKKINLGDTMSSYSLNMFKKLSDKVKFSGTSMNDFMDKCFHLVVLTEARFPQTGQTGSNNNTELAAQFETRFTYVDN